MRECEIMDIGKIAFYPQEVYVLHYKGSPFSISNLSLEEQRKLGVQYPSRGTVTRKCYFTAGHAKTGIKFLSKPIRDQVEIVKYVPVQQEKAIKILETLKRHCDNCPCNFDCKNHNLDDMNCVIDVNEHLV